MRKRETREEAAARRKKVAARLRKNSSGIKAGLARHTLADRMKAARKKSGNSRKMMAKDEKPSVAKRVAEKVASTSATKAAQNAESERTQARIRKQFAKKKPPVKKAPVKKAVVAKKPTPAKKAAAKKKVSSTRAVVGGYGQKTNMVSKNYNAPKKKPA